MDDDFVPEETKQKVCGTMAKLSVQFRKVVFLVFEMLKSLRKI